MITVAIDPGTAKNCGIAVFHDLLLVSVYLWDVRGVGLEMFDARDIDTTGHRDFTLAQEDRCEVVLEVPRVYPGHKAKADPNDLIKLAVAAGRLAQAVLDGTGFGTLICIAPSDWKAQVRKDIMLRRIRDQLTPVENDAVNEAWQRDNVTDAAGHNMLDAVGIGLWRVGRMRPGGAGR